jgi:hypothetical protein
MDRRNPDIPDTTGTLSPLERIRAKFAGQPRKGALTLMHAGSLQGLSAAELVGALRASGRHLLVSGPSLRIRPPLPPDLLDAVRGRKNELRRHLIQEGFPACVPGRPHCADCGGLLADRAEGTALCRKCSAIRTWNSLAEPL